VAGDTPSRVNAVYMTSLFSGGACGSAASAAVYGGAGWTGVCLLGAGMGLATCGLWLVSLRGYGSASGTAANNSRAISTAPGSPAAPT